jgi:hypothetical protein
MPTVTAARFARAAADAAQRSRATLPPFSPPGAPDAESKGYEQQRSFWNVRTPGCQKRRNRELVHFGTESHSMESPPGNPATFEATATRLARSADEGEVPPKRS